MVNYTQENLKIISKAIKLKVDGTLQEINEKLRDASYKLIDAPHAEAPEDLGGFYFWLYFYQTDKGATESFDVSLDKKTGEFSISGIEEKTKSPREMIKGIEKVFSDKKGTDEKMIKEIIEQLPKK